MYSFIVQKHDLLIKKAKGVFFYICPKILRKQENTLLDNKF